MQLIFDPVVSGNNSKIELQLTIKKYFSNLGDYDVPAAVA